MTSFIMHIDANVLHSLYSLRDMRVVFGMIGISELGEWYAVGGLTLVGIVVFLYRRHFAYAQGIALSVATAVVTTTFLKLATGRTRPPLEYQAYHESGYSFPSAHAALSFAFLGFIVFVIWRSRLSRPVRLMASLACIFLGVLIGFSRLYLGVHFLSDVLAGYVVGALCVSLAVWATKALEKKLPTRPKES